MHLHFSIDKPHLACKAFRWSYSLIISISMDERLKCTVHQLACRTYSSIFHVLLERSADDPAISSVSEENGAILVGEFKDEGLFRDSDEK